MSSAYLTLNYDSQTKPNYRLFSAPIDLSVFLGSAVLSLLLLTIGWQFGFLKRRLLPAKDVKSTKKRQ